MNHAVVDAKYCKGCMRCLDVCPKNCLEMSQKGNDMGYKYAMFKNGAECIACGLCYTVCPDVAITVYKEVKE